MLHIVNDDCSRSAAKFPKGFACGACTDSFDGRSKKQTSVVTRTLPLQYLVSVEDPLQSESLLMNTEVQ